MLFFIPAIYFSFYRQTIAERKLQPREICFVFLFTRAVTIENEWHTGAILRFSFSILQSANKVSPISANIISLLYMTKFIIMTNTSS